MRHPENMEKSSMNNGALARSSNSIERLNKEARMLVDIVANENRVTRPRAWQLAGEEAGLPPGTIENLDRERTKQVRVSVRDLIRAALLRKHQNAIREAREQIQTLIREAEAELSIAKLAATHPYSDEVIAAATKLAEGLEAAREITKGEDLG